MNKIYFIVLVQLGIVYTFDLPYQAHSFNHTQMLKQLIKKGARSFTIDIDAISESACNKYGDKDKYDAFELHYDVPVICLGLVGISSGSPFPQGKFQTGDTFIEFLKSEEMKNLLTKINKPLWFRVNYFAYNQISLDQKLMFDFFNNLIDITTQSQHKIQFGIEPCLPILIQEYCVGIIKKLCDRFTYIAKLRDTDVLYCSNNTKEYEHSLYFYTEKKNIKKFCEQGLDQYEDSVIPYEFNVYNKSNDITEVIQYLKNDCKLLKSHEYMLGSNLDIDQFRIVYHLNIDRQDKIYFVHQFKQDFKLLNYFYIEKFNRVVIVILQNNIQTLLITELNSNGFNIVNKAMLVLEINTNEPQIFENFILFQDDSNIYQIEILDDDSIELHQQKIKKECQKIVQSTNGLQCINLIKNNDDTYSISFEYIEDNKQQANEQTVYSLPSSIHNIKNFNVNIVNENYIISLITTSIDDLQQSHTFSYLLYIDVKNKIQSRFMKFIGSIENVEIYDQQLIILLNDSQALSGSKLLNGSDRNMCVDDVEYFGESYTKINKEFNIGYFYGDLNQLIKLKENKFMSVCDDQFIHGSLGFGQKSFVRFIKNNNTHLPVVIKQNVDRQKIDQFSYYFENHIEQDFQSNSLMLLEVDVNSFIKI